MIRYAVIANGQVVNTVLWDGESDWHPGDDYDVIDCADEVNIGWTHDSEGFHAPPEPVVENPA